MMFPASFPHQGVHRRCLDLPRSQLHKDLGQSLDLIRLHQLLIGVELHLFGHTVAAAEIAVIRQRYAQVVVPATECIGEHITKVREEPFSGRSPNTMYLRTMRGRFVFPLVLMLLSQVLAAQLPMPELVPVTDSHRQFCQQLCGCQACRYLASRL